MNMSKRLTRLYACGGAGINISAGITDNVDVPGFSDTKVSRVDTSVANLTTNMPEDSVFVLAGADGSGKERRHNYRPVVAALPQILTLHAPCDYNIVLFSASGGSGSVIGPVILGELLKRKLPSVAIVIGTTGSKTEVQNSIDTLKSLSGVCKASKLPLVMVYLEVNQHNSQADVDRQVTAAITQLLSLFDSHASGLDYKDITNLLQYTNIRGGVESLMSMDIYIDNDIEAITGSFPPSMATVYKDDERPSLPVTPGYHATGTRDKSVTDERMKVTIHFVITEPPVKEHFDGLETRLKNIIDGENAVGNIAGVLSDDDEVDGLGMVL